MRKINPAALLAPVGGKHVHVTMVSPGSGTAYLAGQVAFARDGTLVGVGDLGKQAEQCFANIRDALPDLGATADDLVKIMIYVVDYKSEDLEVIDKAAHDAFGATWPTTAITLAGVQALGFPDFLIEIEAIVEVRHPEALSW